MAKKTKVISSGFFFVIFRVSSRQVEVRTGEKRYYWNATNNVDVLWDPPPGVRPFVCPKIDVKGLEIGTQGGVGSREVSWLQTISVFLHPETGNLACLEASRDR